MLGNKETAAKKDGTKTVFRNGKIVGNLPSARSLNPTNGAIVPSGVGTLPAPETAAPAGYQDIHAAFAGAGRRLSPLERSKAMRIKDLEDTRSIAADPLTEGDTLDYIASRSNDPAALASIAKHPNTRLTTLHALALRLDHNDFEDVICRIGENQKASGETMRLLANSSSEKVKVWAAWHDNTPSECHVDFRDHPDAAVRQGSAENPGNTREMLFYLGNALYEGDGPCRTAAKGNSNYPGVEERLSLATSKSTPLLEREMLAWDTNAKVRKAAREYFGKNRPTADDLVEHVSARGFPRRVAAGIAARKSLLEDKTASVEDF